MGNNYPNHLLENDEDFQDIVMSISGLFWEIDTNGVVKYVSKNIEKILGYTPEEIIGKTIFDFMTPEEAKKIRGVYEKFSLEKGLMIDYENYVLHKDGTKVFILTNGVPILDKNGDLVGFRGVGKDITQLKVAKSHYQNLFDTIPVGIYYTKPDGRILDANHRLVQLLGYPSKESLIATNAAQFYCDSESRRQWQELMESEGVVYDFETWFRRFDGSLILVRNTSRAIKDNDGQIQYYEGVLEDISERKEIEEKLQKSEKRYRELYESSHDAIAATDKNGFVIECNQAYANMLGFSLEELKDIRYQDITPSKWHTLDNEITEQTKTRGYSDEFEKEFIRKDGTVFPVSMRVWRIDDETDDSIGSWVIVRDITERKKAESEILESEKKFRTLFNETPIGLL
ncbi:MAG: PAS domain-containing protein, partial [Candidatus Thorarchaeota archaeon]|nr:PAS domain-containing protein [Candidatus Thorarchaeota archaeon]